MTIYTYYSPESVHFLALWFRSWKKRGWKPRLILPSDPDPAGKKISPYILNFSFRPRDHKKIFVIRVPAEPDWVTCPLVNFTEKATVEDVNRCGRKLCL